MDVSSVTTILPFVLAITWTCLRVPLYKNPLFDQVFFCLEVLSEIIAAASLSFAPGLLEILQAASPPSIEFFRNLPTKIHGLWGLYALLLEKQGAVPLVYYGTGTGALSGAASRLVPYNNPDSTSFARFVKAALDDGYTITHMGLLIWCPIPTAADVPRFRLLFIAMEAALTFYFWVMKSKTADYSMADCCRWARDSLTYGGLCGHSPLSEGVRGNFDLTAEQLEAMAAATKERQRLLKVDYNKAYSTTENGIRYFERNQEAIKESQRLHRETHLDSVRATNTRSALKIKASEKFNCSLCSTPCKSQWELDRHNASTKHMIRVRKAKAGVALNLRCTVCSYSTEKKGSLKRHLEGKRHLDKVAAATAALSSASA